MAFIIPDVKMDFKELISKFAIPVDIKYDIIYCQKKLFEYIKVHKIITSKISKEKMERQAIENIEKDIWEISREQKQLLIRLRSILDEYYTSLKSENVEIDRSVGNAYIAQQLQQNFDYEKILLGPTNVKKRHSEEELITKYDLTTLKANDRNDSKTTLEPVELIVAPNANYSFPMNSQVSLLKPKSERIAVQNFFNDLVKIKNEDISHTTDMKNPMPARTVKSSRLNLLQALEKAKFQKQPVKLPLSPDNLRDETISPQMSSSDDSLDAPIVPSSGSDEFRDNASDDKEAFLRYFGLYTDAYIHHIKQRRSKRRRRNVQSNEKSDFHYGSLDTYSKTNKRKKQLLLAPPTKILKRKKDEIDSESTTSKVIIDLDRSSSSSPDPKRLCNECFKSGDDVLPICTNCKGSYHMKCHRHSLTQHPLRLRGKLCPACLRIRQDCKDEPEYLLREKLLRAALKNKYASLKFNQNKLLGTFDQVKDKLQGTKLAKEELVKQGEKLKLKMSNYFNIVNKLKR